MVKCKIKRRCYLKACTTRKSGCPYNYGPNDVNPYPARSFERRYQAMLRRVRIVSKYPEHYEAAFQHALSARYGARRWDLFSPLLCEDAEQREAARYGLDAGYKGHGQVNEGTAYERGCLARWFGERRHGGGFIGDVRARDAWFDGYDSDEQPISRAELIRIIKADEPRPRPKDAHPLLTY